MTQTRAARLAGALYVTQMATGIFGFMVRSSPMVRGDLARTAENILTSERMFRLSIVTDVAMVAQVIALTWALYVLLRPVNKDVALLGAWFRIAENAVICALTAQLIVAIGLFRQPEYMSAFDAAQANALGRLFLSANILGYNLAFILLGLGSAVFAYLLFESRYVPRVLAGVGVIGCLVFASVRLARSSFRVRLNPFR
jgi:hypothetical protein